MTENDQTHSAQPSREPSIALLWILVGVMIVIEIAASLGDAGVGPVSRNTLMYYGAFWITLLDGMSGLFRGQQWTMFLSHAFLHGGAAHVAMNTVVLLSVGKLVATICGQFRALILFALTAIAGGIGFWLLAPVELVPMVGASGAVFGFLGAWKRWEFNALRATGQSVRGVGLFVLGMIVLNIALAFALQGGLAWQAHLGGGVAGWLIAPYLARRPGRA